jgi:hypothetical protein
MEKELKKDSMVAIDPSPPFIIMLHQRNENEMAIAFGGDWRKQTGQESNASANLVAMCRPWNATKCWFQSLQIMSNQHKDAYLYEPVASKEKNLRNYLAWTISPPIYKTRFFTPKLSKTGQINSKRFSTVVLLQ